MKNEDEVIEFADSIGATVPSYFKSKFKRQNYFMLHDNFLIIKISRPPKLFWGFKKEYLEYCDSLFLVLLTSKRSGYIYSKKEIISKIRNGEWNLCEADNNYKINKNTLNSRNSFGNPEMFLKKISENIKV